MLKNYLKLAFRHLWQKRLYSVINITGLAIGLACFLLALLYLRDERQYDRFHEKAANIYRITATTKERTVGGTGQVQGAAFKAEVPGIENYTRVMGGSIYGDLVAGSTVVKQQLLFADPSFFDVFSFRALYGNTQTALQETGSVVLSESAARRLFNTADVVGRTLEMSADPSAQRLGKPMVITAVVADPPSHSSIRFDAVLPFRFMQLSFEDDSWDSFYLGTYVVLHPSAKPAQVAVKMNAAHKGRVKVVYGLQPLTAIHLNPLYQPNSSMEAGVANGSNPLYSWMFLGIAAFILLMAGINFINLSIAGAMKRAREVCVRKLNGGLPRQIILQFLLEAGLLCFAALLLAMVITLNALPLFNRLTGAFISPATALDISFFVYAAALLVIIVVATGAYPAVVLNRFQPADILRNRMRLSGRNVLGRSLVIVQFSLSVFLVISTLLFYRQMDYVRTKDLGYKPQQVIRSNIGGNADPLPVKSFLQSELTKEPGVRALAFGGEYSGESPVKLGEQELQVKHRVIDEHYLTALNIPLKEGRNFFTGEAEDGLIVNEAFVKAARLPSPIGTQVRMDPYHGNEVRTIVGVVKDFHYGSLRESIQPLLMFKHKEVATGIWISYEQARQPQVLAAFEAAYRKALPAASFEYQFLDQLNAREYAQEQRWRTIISIAAILSVLICASGLFGMAHMAVQQRYREISVRKVLGASVSGIAILFSKDLLKPVLPAFLLAAPAAWWVMRYWLQQFAYQADITWWIFAAGGFFATVTALAAVLSQVLQAAWANPLKHLRAD